MVFKDERPDSQLCANASQFSSFLAAQLEFPQSSTSKTGYCSCVSNLCSCQAHPCPDQDDARVPSLPEHPSPDLNDVPLCLSSLTRASLDNVRVPSADAR